MISKHVRGIIRDFSNVLVECDPLFVRLRKTGLDVRVVCAYLSSTRYLISQTIPNLGLAAQKARELGQHDLASCFLRKLREETGHDQWATEDISSLSRQFEIQDEACVVPAVLELVRLNRALIEVDPRLYLLYTLCAEYVTVLAGPAWVESLSAAGIPSASLSVVTKHVQADQEHAEDGFRLLDEFLGETWPAPAVERTLGQVFASLRSFCADLLALQRELDACPRPERQTVPA
jgi:hypothetical protein